jgi:hypothetical protein
MKINILSLGQLLEKGDKIKMKDCFLTLLDTKEDMIAKVRVARSGVICWFAPVSRNQVEAKTVPTLFTLSLYIHISFLLLNPIAPSKFCPNFNT